MAGLGLRQYRRLEEKWPFRTGNLISMKYWVFDQKERHELYRRSFRTCIMLLISVCKSMWSEMNSRINGR